MVTVHIHRDFKMPHNHLIFLILGDHAKVRRADFLKRIPRPCKQCIHWHIVFINSH